MTFFFRKKNLLFVLASFLLGPLFFSVFAQDLSAPEPVQKMDARVILRQLQFDNQEQLEESRRLLVSALAFDPGNADYHFELSRVYGALYDESVPSQGKKKVGETKFLDMSQAQLEQVLMIRPKDIPAHYNLGVIYKRRGKMELARGAFQRVIQLAQKESLPSNVPASAWLQIGSVYEEQGFFEEARDAYMKAREVGGNSPEVQDALQGIGEKQTRERKTPPQRADGWTREYVSGADYTQFGADALRAQKQNAGIGALVPMAGMMLFDQFMQRRIAAQQDQNL